MGNCWELWFICAGGDVALKFVTLKGSEFLIGSPKSLEFKIEKTRDVQLVNLNFDVDFRSRNSKFEWKFVLWLRDFRNCFSGFHKIGFVLWFD